jgi:hypothetical protein
MTRLPIIGTLAAAVLISVMPLTIAAPANASSAAHSTQIAQPEPGLPKTGPKVGQPFSGDPYPESDSIPSLPGNP